MDDSYTLAKQIKKEVQAEKSYFFQTSSYRSVYSNYPHMNLHSYKIHCDCAIHTSSVADPGFQRRGWLKEAVSKMCP